MATIRWRDGMPLRPFFPWHPNDTVYNHARCVEMTPPGYWILRDCNSPKKPFICKRAINPYIDSVYKLVNETPGQVQDPAQPVYPHAYKEDFKRFWGMSMIDMDGSVQELIIDLLRENCVIIGYTDTNVKTTTMNKTCTVT
ncbi:uncharacterized protein LOC144927761 [Branchiostoma floridae x Branchiostoma belcheri]